MKRIDELKPEVEELGLSMDKSEDYIDLNIRFQEKNTTIVRYQYRICQVC